MTNLIKKQAFDVFDMLSEKNQRLIVELIETLAPDDIATQDDVQSHTAAMEDYRNGNTVALEDL